jgi:hypothetical protein
MEIMKNKASLEELNNLHGLVAIHLAHNLDDPKVLAQAVKFLKDNQITADVVEENNFISITDSIKKLASNSNNKKISLTIEDMLELD